MKNKTIFISVTSFNEEDLVNTLHNAVANARYPDRLFFGVFYHQTDGNFASLSKYTENVYKTDHPDMLGVGVSRFLANHFYAGQDYYLQIDAHTIFDSWWDDRLIRDLELIKSSGVEKPIISYYLPSWIRKDDDSIQLSKFSFGSTLVWDHEQMNNHYSDIPLMSTEPVDWSSEPNTFKRHYGIAAQFLFADGNFCKEAIPDEQIMFYGEEPTLALRCFSFGYQVFSTMNCYMWHKNKIISKNPKNDRITFSPKDKELKERHKLKKALGLFKTKQILTGEYFGYWGAKDPEVLRQYEEESQFSFAVFYENQKEKEEGGVLWYEQ